MKKRSTLLFGSMLLLGLCLGCIRVPGGISSSTTPINSRAYSVIGEAYGEETHYDLLGIVPLSRANHLQNAIEDAKKQSGADALVDVTVESVKKVYILFTSYTVEVRGKAIKFKQE